MRIGITLLAVLASLTSTFASELDHYSRTIKPLLANRCLACHGALKQEGGLRLDSGARIQRGGESGAAVAVADPSMSLLVQRISATDESERMPPEGQPLSPAEIEAVVKWIADGAHSPADEKEQIDPRDHWAFRKPTKPALPSAVEPEWGKNPIDLFISQRHRELDVQPLPMADRETLLRRVYLDLIGLPPSRQELKEFLQADSLNAYDRVVDRLLNRPEHGERWARHWMDVWRYSDWYGRRAVPDVMNSYPHIWRWRDWIVASLNEDKGYDRMVQEMLAADELAPGDDRNVVATGFLVRNWFKWNYENWMKDNVEHTAKAFLGLTLQCAHCHDHKYDPLTQEEYFRFRAFFEPLELRQDRVVGLPDPGPFVKYVYAKAYGPTAAGMVRVFDEKLEAPTYMYEKGDARNRIQGRQPVAAGVPSALGNREFEVKSIELPPEAFYPGLKSFIREDERDKLQQQIAVAQQECSAAETKLKHLEELSMRGARRADASPANIESTGTKIASETGIVKDQGLLTARTQWRMSTQKLTSLIALVRSLEARIAADDARYRGLGDTSVLSRAASQAERMANYEVNLLRLSQSESNLLAAQQKQPADDKAKSAVDKALKELNDARAALDAIRSELSKESDQYTPLSPVYPATSTGRRLALAKWIADRENPLTARVAVNHLWMRHFGKGLVDTPSNFGTSGHAPSHPELLDFLAVELMENGWQMKHIHRMIVTSQTYRLGSSLGIASHPNQAVDPDNKGYWRANPQRMEAEVVRDSLLAVAGELDASLGGPEIEMAQGLSSNRRSMYFAIHGEGKMQFLELFDAADVCDCYQRTSSVRPQQALALTNSELPLRVSQTLAKKLWSQSEEKVLPNPSPLEQTGQAANSKASDEFITAAFEAILSRLPTVEEMQVSHQFLQAQSKIAASEQPDTATVAKAPATQLPADPDERARMTLVHALFSHNDFVTIR